MPYFKGGKPVVKMVEQLDAIRDILTSNGRSLVQGALAWLMARSDRALPIPGIRTVVQANENAGAMQFGAMDDGQMAEIERLVR